MYREGVGKRRLIGEHLVKTDAVRVKIFSIQSLEWQKETPAEKQVVEGNLGNAIFPSLKYGRPSQNAHAVLETSPPVSFGGIGVGGYPSGQSDEDVSRAGFNAMNL